MEQQADGRYGPWILAEGSSPVLFDGGDPDNITNVMFTHNTGDNRPFSPQVCYARAINRESSAANFGLGARLHKNAWKAGQWVHGTTTYTDDTTDAQSTATADFPLEVAATANSGFIVQSFEKFNALSILVSTASVGTPTRIIEYSNSAGGWTTLSRQVSAAMVSSNYGTGENIVWWVTPTDWAPIVAGHGTGLTVGWYGMRFRSTTAPATTAGVATSLSVHRIFAPQMSIAQYGVYEFKASGFYLPLNQSSNAVFIASSTASSGHAACILARGKE